ncbi:MAG: type II toxin-antitoxin system RelE/ParE family toxin [Dehalococcoidales bacterium]|nr:type II toxin-antitoxin system RelE/ParE family toxin [Dehalococcoidales bacterium]
MKTYRLVYSERAHDELKKLDNSTARIIISWLEKNIDGCENPRAHGKGLSGNKAGQWRYRVGKYRVICKIEDDAVIVLVLAVGHRSTIYR